MTWIGFKVKKVVVGVLIGLFAVCEVVLPGVSSALKSAPFEKLFSFVFGAAALKQLEAFADWKLNEGK